MTNLRFMAHTIKLLDKYSDLQVELQKKVTKRVGMVYPFFDVIYDL